MKLCESQLQVGESQKAKVTLERALQANKAKVIYKIFSWIYAVIKQESNFNFSNTSSLFKNLLASNSTTVIQREQKPCLNRL